MLKSRPDGDLNAARASEWGVALLAAVRSNHSQNELLWSTYLSGTKNEFATVDVAWDYLTSPGEAVESRAVRSDNLVFLTVAAGAGLAVHDVVYKVNGSMDVLGEWGGPNGWLRCGSLKPCQLEVLPWAEIQEEQQEIALAAAQAAADVEREKREEQYREAKAKLQAEWQARVAAADEEAKHRTYQEGVERLWQLELERRVQQVREEEAAAKTERELRQRMESERSAQQSVAQKVSFEVLCGSCSRDPHEVVRACLTMRCCRAVQLL